MFETIICLYLVVEVIKTNLRSFSWKIWIFSKPEPSSYLIKLYRVGDVGRVQAVED